jgi:hypothetical protein
MSLFKHGASRAAAISFLLSTPQTGVDSILVTFSLLGPLFAVFRPVAAFITGIVGGAIVNIFVPHENPSKNGLQKESQSGHNECCRKEKAANRVLKGLRYGFVVLPRDIARPLLVGIIIAAFISALVPDDFFAEVLPSGILAMLVMMVLGIPVYVCATASVPIAAAMMMKGLSPGAALVFLVTGPATNAATIITIWKILGRKTALIYILTVVGCSLAGGLFLDFLAGAGSEPMFMVHQHGWMLPRFINYVAAAALFIVLGFAIIHRSPKANEIESP